MGDIIVDQSCAGPHLVKLAWSARSLVPTSSQESGDLADSSQEQVDAARAANLHEISSILFQEEQAWDILSDFVLYSHHRYSRACAWKLLEAVYHIIGWMFISFC